MKLPTAADLGRTPVPTPSRNTGDFRGVGNPVTVASYSALKGAQGKNEADALEKPLADVTNILAREHAKTMNREDTLARIDALDQFEQQTSANFEKAQTEGDYSKQATADAFYSGMREQSNMLLNNYSGSQDGRDLLAQALAERQASWGRLSSNAMIQAQRAKVNARVERDIGYYARQAADNPGTLDVQLDTYRKQIEGYGGAMTQEDQIAATRVGFEEISSAAIYNRIAAGDYTGAAAALDKLPDGMLSPGRYSQLRREITIGMGRQGMERNPWEQKFEAFRTVMGRNPSQGEAMNMMGASRADPHDTPPKIVSVPQGDKMEYFQQVKDPQTGQWTMQKIPGVEGQKPQSMMDIMTNAAANAAKEGTKPGEDHGQGKAWYERALGYVFGPSDEGGKAELPTVGSQEEIDNMAPGTWYQDPQGGVHQR